ncbi:MAG: hypothetical protein ACREEM_47315 [Blastocatellia bacterium]
MNKSRLSFILALLFLLVSLSGEARAQFRFDRPKTEPPLDNPYTVGVPREQIVQTVREILKTCAIPIDEDLSRSNEGKLVTKNVIFARGVTAKNDLEHLATMPAGEVREWQQGRYHLEITALPLDGKKSQIQVSAFFQGKVADAMRSNLWIDGQSNGLLEDDILRGLAGKILGIDLSVKGNNKRRILNCEY